MVGRKILGQDPVEIGTREPRVSFLSDAEDFMAVQKDRESTAATRLRRRMSAAPSRMRGTIKDSWGWDGRPRLSCRSPVGPQPGRHHRDSKRICVYCWGPVDRQCHIRDC
jgi:hypothetical protein